MALGRRRPTPIRWLSRRIAEPSAVRRGTHLRFVHLRRRGSAAPQVPIAKAGVTLWPTGGAFVVGITKTVRQVLDGGPAADVPRTLADGGKPGQAATVLVDGGTP